ncbi:MAG: phosphatidylglycerophosphatase A [Granulosicoccaceae bacterium]
MATSLKQALFANPQNFLALGAGSGLAPVAPGTFGTVAAIPLLFILPSNPWLYGAITMVMFVVGVYLCGNCADYMQTHDHPAIVWDEWVGLLITMFLVPLSIVTVILGFALFRFFDILKPWPIGLADKKISGGLGIMIDDVLAGIMAAIVMHLLLLAFDLSSLTFQL